MRQLKQGMTDRHLLAVECAHQSRIYTAGLSQFLQVFVGSWDCMDEARRQAAVVLYDDCVCPPNGVLSIGMWQGMWDWLAGTSGCPFADTAQGGGG